MRKRYIYWGLVLLWCFMIYEITASPAATSENTTSYIGLLQFSPDTVDIINYCIRKAAHMTLFGVLALLIFKALEGHRYSLKLAWLLSTLYGATDELHQHFMPDRTSTPVDVGIDSLGAFIALFLFIQLSKWLVLRPTNKRKRTCPKSHENG